MEKAGILAKLVANEAGRALGHPAFWTAAAVAMVLAQVGFWTEFHSNPAGTSASPSSVLDLGISILSFWSPMAGILLAASLAGNKNDATPDAQTTAARLVAVPIVLSLIPLITAAALLPSAISITALYSWDNLMAPLTGNWIPDLELMGQALWTAAAYAALTGLAITLIGRKWAAAPLFALWTLLEYIVFQLTMGWHAGLEWTAGLLPSQMYQHWMGDPLTTLGNMRNLLGMDDPLQGFAVLGLHLCWATAATLAVNHWRKKKNEQQIDQDRWTTRAALPGARAMTGLATAAITLAMLPMAVGITTIQTKQPPQAAHVAGIHIVNNTWDISGRVANAIAPEDPLEQELQRGLWASITSEIKDFQCKENPEGPHANGETTVHCMINAAIWDPFYLVINAPVTITVDLEQDKRFPEPKVRRVTLEPRTISAIGEVYNLEVFQAKEDPANNWSR